MTATGGIGSKGQEAGRPPLFLALGRREPPPYIELEDRRLRLVQILKHDSWAATVIYANDVGTKVACKFNRIQSLGFIPMRWLGSLLAEREQKVMRLMQDVEGFPRWAGPVMVNGQVWSNAVAHDWIEGRPFNPWLRVPEPFFPRLREMVVALHRHDIAYVDMSKWENILLGDDGKPYLIDFQIHFQLRRGWPLRWWLRSLQGGDLFYVHRHWSRVRPEQLNAVDPDWARRCPRIIRIGEATGPAWRSFRRMVLRLFGVREDDRKTGIHDHRQPNQIHPTAR